MTVMTRAWLATAALTLFSADAIAAKFPNCLHAQAEPSPSGDDRCLGDAFQLAQHQTVRNAIEALGLGNAKITFKGCLAGVFGTRAPSPHTYVITYKLSRSVTPAQMFDLLLPIMHELGHVFQIERYGSIGDVRDKLETQAQIELGADFIAGALYHWRWRGYNTTAFNASIELMGDYQADGGDFHGRPEDRAAAFQFGFDYPLTGIGRNIAFGAHALEFEEAHETFQADDYPALVEMR